MASSRIVKTPADFVPAQAISFGGFDGAAVAVDASNPLPVTFASPAPTPLTGTMAASGIAGPFAQVPGRPIWLSLSGEWTGAARLLRSTDGGTTRLPLTIAGADWASYSGNCNEPVTEETEAGATYYLSVELTSGNLTYRVSQ